MNIIFFADSATMLLELDRLLINNINIIWVVHHDSIYKELISHGVGKDRIKFYCFCEEGIFNTHSNVFLDYALFNESKKQFVLNYIKDNWRNMTRSGDLKCDENTERDNEYWIRYSTKFLKYYESVWFSLLEIF